MNSSSFFNLLDYIYIVIMLASTGFGLSKGFSRALLGIFAWIFSGFLSTLATPYMLKFMEGHFSNRNTAYAVSAVTSYLVILVILLIVVNFIADRVKRSALSGLDRALGGLFGLVRGIIFPLCVCGIFITLKIDHSKITIMSESKISGILFGLIPLSVQATEKNNATRSSRKKNEIMAKIKKINEAKKISNFKITKPLRDNSKKNSSKITRALATKQGDGLN